MAQAVIATFDFAEDVFRGLVPAGLVEIAKVVDIVEVHQEPPDLLRDFSFGVFDRGNDFAGVEKDFANVTSDVFEIGFRI
jgi:hypothetical protein